MGGNLVGRDTELFKHPVFFALATPHPEWPKSILPEIGREEKFCE
jgi:hypothetical protein